MMRSMFVAVLASLVLPLAALTQAFQLAPAVAVEAEDFTVASGWKVVKNGEGNYMVDIVGFNHISGERVLSLASKEAKASAHTEVTVPVAGKYRLWVRYEYPAFCETRFRVVVEQGGKTVASQVMGKKDSPRYSFGDTITKTQYDPPWGSEGLCEEVVTLDALAKGKATIRLEGVEQPQTPGVSADRNIDCIYLTSDATDAWMKHYRKQTTLYPILDAIRDTRGPRWEVRFTNKSDKPASYRIQHIYNRIPWYVSDPALVNDLKPNTSSAWLRLKMQDTTHFGMTEFSGPGALEVEIRAVGAKDVAKKLVGTAAVRAYLPPYADKEEKPTSPEEAIDRILAHLKATRAPGKVPTKPLCYGGWMPLGQDNDYGRKYAQLYAALGFRSLHPAHSGPKAIDNLKVVGVPVTKSWMAMTYRNPPTKTNIDKARADAARLGLDKELKFFDYGDEIAFSEWLDMMANEEVAKFELKKQKVTPQQIIAGKWIEWLKANRPKNNPADYWLAEWGPINAANFRPDSSAKAAKEKPRLYVDSLLFYEDTAITFAAQGMKAAKAALGEDVLCGANYSCHPFYYPHSTMYIKWFRGGAADLGRHSEYFWQVGQAGPMINGYVAEHFRAGMRENPKAVLRQYTMPHSPGNTDASFLRSAFSHLAHGATMLDFFGIGLNEAFTENHIDHRDVKRFQALRDITHCVGFVEDLLPASKVVPSQVALLVSESTERWDYAGIATDRAGHAHFGPDFRKTRLVFHLERLGLWKALTFMGASPDLVTEEDITKKKLKGYKFLVLVGDHWPREMVPALKEWIEAGGVALATAASGQRDMYGEKMDDFHKLAGIKDVKTTMHETFMRPRQELPFMKQVGAWWSKAPFPCLATEERFEAEAGAKVVGRFEDDRLAGVQRDVGKGRVVYVAAHLGLAFLSASLPKTVPDRGPHTHPVPDGINRGVRTLLELFLEGRGASFTRIEGAGMIDARLLESSGRYLVPIANYAPRVGEKEVLSVRVGKKITKATSAFHGDLKIEQKEKGGATITLPSLGYGDILRLEVAK